MIETMSSSNCSLIKRSNPEKGKGRQLVLLRNETSKLVKRKSQIILLLLGSLILLLSAGPSSLGAKTHHSKRQTPISGSSPAALSGRENSNWWNVWWQQYINEAELPTARPIVAVSFRGRNIIGGHHEEQQHITSDAELTGELDDGRDDVNANLVLSNSGSRQAHAQPANELGRLVNERQRLIASSEKPLADDKQMLLTQHKSMQHHYNWQAVKPTFIQSGNRQPVDNSPLGIQMRRTMRLQQQQQQERQQQLEQRFEEQQQHQMIDYNEDSEPEIFNQVNNNSNNNGDDEPALTLARPRDSSSSSMMAGDGANSATPTPTSSLGISEPTTKQETSSPSGMSTEITGSSDSPPMSTTGLVGRMSSESKPISGQTQPATGTPAVTQPTTVATTASSAISRVSEDTTGTTSKSFTTSQAPVTVGTTITREDQKDTTAGQATQSTIASETQTMEPGTRLAMVTPPNGGVQLENGKPASTTTTAGTIRPISSSMNRFPPRVMTITTPQQVDQQSTTAMSSVTVTPSTLTPTSTSKQPDEVVTTNQVNSMDTPSETSSTGTTSATELMSSANETTTTTIKPANANSSSSSDNDDDSDDANDEADETDSEDTSTGSTISAANSESSTTQGSFMGERERESSPGGQQENSSTQSTASSASSSQSASSTDSSLAVELSTTTQPILPTMDLERLPKTTSTQASSSSPSSMQTATTAAETPIVISTSTSPQRIQTTQVGMLSNTEEDISRITRPPMMSQTSADDNMLTSMRMTTLSRGQMDDESAITIPMDSLMNMMMNRVVEDNERAKLQQQDSSSGTTTFVQGTEQTEVNPTSPSRQTDETNQSTTKSMTQTSMKEIANLEQSTGTTSAPEIDLNRPTTKSHLQPPPTTRTPVQTTNSFMDGSIMTTLSQTPPQRTVTVNLSPAMTSSSSSSSDEGSFDGREPKVEMLDLDLMPIQRIMSQNQDQNQVIMVPIGKLIERPRENNNEDLGQVTSTKSSDGLMTELQQKPMTIEVEPGMRLRPPQISMGSTKGMMTPIMMRSQQQGKQPAEPIYMIMMNNNNQAPTTSIDQFNTMTNTNRPTPPRTTMATKTTNPVDSTGTSSATRTTPGMMVMMMQRQQQQQQIQLQNLMTNKPMMTTILTSDTKTSEPSTPSFMKTTQTVPSQQTTKTTMTLSDISTTRQQQLMTTTTTSTTPFTTQEPQTTRQQQNFNQKEGQSESKSSTEQSDSKSADNTIMTTTVEPNTLLITDSPASLTEQGAMTTTKAPSTTEGTTELERFVTTPMSNYFTQQGSSTTFNPTSLVTTNRPESTTTSEAADNKQTSFTEGTTSKSTTIADSQLKQQQTTNQKPTKTTASSTGLFMSTKEVPIKTGKVNQEASEKKSISSGSSNVKGANSATKHGKQHSNGTSTFISPKLRSDFGKQRAYNNPTAPPMNTAIRQFGGANRMSVLGNQPVPFGRPAAMTLPNRNQQQPQQRFHQLYEQPLFEYGPSIVVRRPDEPLANGQMPNCTLTGKNFCVLTKDYPMNEVRQAVERSFRSVRIMYEELQTVSDQELHKDQFNTTNNQAASGKFACQTQVEMMRPGWAKDEITKEWMLVVNTDVFPQRVRTESCAQPNTPCEFIAPFYDSTCQQRYSLHRMIAIDPHDPSRSPQVAVFRFPAGCVCRVHPIKKTTTTSSANLATTSSPITLISNSQSGTSSRKRR